MGPGHDLEVAAVDAGEVEAAGEKDTAQQAAGGDEERGAHADHVGDGAPQQAAEDDRRLEHHQVGAERPRKDPAGHGLLDAQVEGGHRHEPGGAENGQRHGGHRPLVDERQEHRAAGRDDAGHGQHGVEREALVQPGQDQGGS